MKTVSIGSGTTNGSPYISVWGTTKLASRPWAIGWLGLITQTRSFSPASRHLSAQGVPISFLKIFEKWPEWRTIRPMPCQTRSATRSTISSLDLAVGAVAPPGQHVGLRQALDRQPVLRLLEGGGRRLDRRVVVQGVGDRAMHSLGVDLAHDRVLAVMDVLSPDDGTDSHFAFPKAVSIALAGREAAHHSHKRAAMHKPVGADILSHSAQNALRCGGAQGMGPADVPREEQTVCAVDCRALARGRLALMADGAAAELVHTTEYRTHAVRGTTPQAVWQYMNAHPIIDPGRWAGLRQSDPRP